jgi:hypothetical protein
MILECFSLDILHAIIFIYHFWKGFLLIFATSLPVAFLICSVTS